MGRLKQQVFQLQQKVNLLLSCRGLEQTQSSNNNQVATDPENNNSSTPDTYASVAAATPGLTGSIRSAVLTAVYTDLHIKDIMKRNVVIYGINPDDELIDIELIQELCSREFNYVPDIVNVRRLGKPSADRVQPLLVVLQSEFHANQLLDCARHLRQSEDEYTSLNVFISPHQTRAERQAAYESRCRRRQQTVTQQATATKSDGRQQRSRDPRGKNPTGSSKAGRPTARQSAAAPRRPVEVVQSSGHHAVESADVRTGPVAPRGASGQAAVGHPARVESAAGPVAAAATSTAVSVCLSRCACHPNRQLLNQQETPDRVIHGR
jgi:hypothetical protein